MDEIRLPPGSRLTRQRRAVVDAVAREAGSFTVAELYERARRAERGLGMATVYRTVELLRESGSVRALAGRAHAYVRCHDDHHHHLVCRTCGSVQETDLCGAPAPEVLRRRYGFAAEGHELEIYGTCADCEAA